MVTSSVLAEVGCIRRIIGRCVKSTSKDTIRAIFEQDVRINEPAKIHCAGIGSVGKPVRIHPGAGSGADTWIERLRHWERFYFNIGTST
jgi:hypothetical protein